MGILEQMIEAPAAGTMSTSDDDTMLTVDVGGASEAQVLGTLVTSFGNDESCAGIRLLRGGDVLGVVHREAALGIVGDGQKGYGSSDPMWLPGIANYSTSRWCCPLGGSHYCVTLIVLGDAPTCPHHPGQPLELQP
jgi:hypothetical protein